TNSFQGVTNFKMNFKQTLKRFGEAVICFTVVWMKEKQKYLYICPHRIRGCPLGFFFLFPVQMKKFLLFSIVGIIVFPAITMAQADSSEMPFKEKKKTGWTWAALPVVAYDADMGLQLGALGQVFYYGNGSTWPEYRHTIYAECSWFTKGSAVYQLFYDSKYLIPGKIRITADLDYLTERALDFYGFNGYESNYIPSVAQQGTDDYISRVFYKHERKMLRAMADFQGPLWGQKLRWLAGINVIDIRTATVNIDKINKGKKDENKLPDTTLLYDQYIKYGLIGPEEKNGGTTVYLKLGIVFDTRDNEAAPEKGFWSEIMLLAAPTFLGNNPYAFVKLAVTHRQFIPIVKRRLVAAYQLSYQGKIGGSTPFYILPYIYSSYSLTTKPDGLGGAKTLRGILRNRITGDGVAFGNIELRWTFLNAVVWKQNLSLGITGFLDGGMVVQDHPVPMNLVPVNQQPFYFNSAADRLHLSTGLGLRAAINHNFIISVDYGFALDRQDGTSGLYLGIGNIF
ncbi:MAG: BamA/TamA family outer membrane protein, partial [Bacteroidota bacterium]